MNSIIVIGLIVAPFAVCLTLGACTYNPSPVLPIQEQVQTGSASVTPEMFSTAIMPTGVTDCCNLRTDWENPIRIAIGDTITFQHDNFAITFAEVLEDSRCHYFMGEDCKWEGNAKVKLRVKHAEDMIWTEITLNTYSEYPQEARYASYTIVLTNVEPDWYQPIVENKEYSILLEVMSN